MTATAQMPVARSMRGIRAVFGLATVAALITNLAVFETARAGGVDFVLPNSGPADAKKTVTAVMVAVTTVVAMAVGWALTGLAARLQRPALRTMAFTGGIFGALSALWPLSLDGPISVKLTLASLHLTTAVFYVGGIASLQREDAGATR